MKKTILYVSLAATLLTGCGDKAATLAMPEVNDANCKMDVIKNISNQETRQTFTGLCSRRPVIEKTEKPLNWLDLSEPKQDAKP